MEGNYNALQKGLCWTDVRQRGGNFNSLPRVEYALAILRLVGIDAGIFILPPLCEWLVEGRGNRQWGLAQIDIAALRDLAQEVWFLVCFSQDKKCPWFDGSMAAEVSYRRFLHSAAYLLFCCRQYKLCALASAAFIRHTKVARNAAVLRCSSLTIMFYRAWKRHQLVELTYLTLKSFVPKCLFQPCTRCLQPQGRPLYGGCLGMQLKSVRTAHCYKLCYGECPGCY